MRTPLWLAVLLAELLGLGPVAAQTYTPISGYTPVDLSADGTTLVGYGDVGNGFENVVHDWSVGAPLGIGGVNARCISGDGATVGGGIAGSPLSAGGYYAAEVWTDLGSLNATLFCGLGPVPTDMASDGTRLVGHDFPASCLVTDAFYWDALTLGPMTPLLKLGSGASRALSVSGDGLAVGGSDEGNTATTKAALWKWDATTGAFGAPTLLLAGIDFGDGNLDGAGTVSALNEDGSAAAIMAGLNSAPNVKLWRNGTVLDLGAVPGYPGSRPFPTGISRDGRMVVGEVGISLGSVGFVWTESGGMQDADDFLADIGVPLPAGFVCGGIQGCSSDGKTLFGRVGTFFSSDYFVAELPATSQYGVGVSPTNSLDLVATGSTSVSAPGVLTLTTSGTGAAAFVVRVVSQAPSNVPLLGGVLLVNPVIPNLQPPILTHAASGGVSTSTLTMPSDAALAGRSFYVQTAAPDAAMPAGWALSNGVRGVLCP